MIPCKFCGKEGQVVDVKYKPGAITVQCSKCGARTEDADTVKGAVQSWQEQRFLPCFLPDPVKAEEMYTENALLLIEAILEESGKEYRELLRKKKYQYRRLKESQRMMLDYAIDRCERSFRNSTFVAATGLKADEILLQIQNEEGVHTSGGTKNVHKKGYRR